MCMTMLYCFHDMDSLITIPLKPRPWWKRWWGIVAIIFSALVVLYALWFTFAVVSSVRDIKAGRLRAIGDFTDQLTTSKRATAAPADGKAELVRPWNPVHGDPQAAITIIEFGDYQCPFTFKEFPIIRSFMGRIPGVKFVYRDFPLIDIHPNAVRAAHAAACARDQGEFWKYHDQLFLHQQELGDDKLGQYAQRIGLDQKKFDVCMKEQKHIKEIERDYQDGLALGVRGTPTFFVQGIRVQGAVPQGAWIEIFRRLGVMK